MIRYATVFFESEKILLWANRCLLIDRCLEIIKPYFNEIIEKPKESREYRTQLSVRTPFGSSKDINKYPYIHSWKDNKDIKMSEETDNFTEKLFEWLLKGHQELLVKKDFVFHHADSLK